MNSNQKNASFGNSLKRRKVIHKLSILGLCAGLTLGLNDRALADNTWDGGGTSGNWSDLVNWGANTTPVSPTALTFGGTLQLASNNDLFAAATTFNGITFSAGSGAFTLTGNSITLGGNIANNGTSSQTISMDLILSATRTVTTATGGGNVTLSGVTSGAFGLVKAGLGTLTLNGAAVNTYTGSTAVNGGTLLVDLSNLATPTDLINSASTLTTGGGILNIKGKATGTTSQTLGNVTQTGSTYNGIVVNANGGTSTTLNLGTLGHNAGGTTLIDISSSGSAVTTTSSVANGLLNASYLVKDATNTGFATKSGSNVVRYDDTTGTTLANTATVATTNYTTLASGTSLTLLGGAQSLNSLAIDTTSGAQTIDLNTGIKTITSSGVLFRGANNATLSNGQIGANNAETIVHQIGTGKLTISGTVGSGTASLTKDGTGELVLSGTNTYTGATRVLDGTLTVNGALGATTVTVGGGAATTGTTPVFNLGTGSSLTTGTLTIQNPNAVATISQANALGSAVTLNLNSGTLNINAAQTRTTAVNVNAGFTLGIGDDNALGTANLVLGNGTIMATNGAHTIANTFEQGNANSTIAGSNNLTFTGLFSNKGSASLLINNTGLTTFGGGISLRDTGTAQRSLTLLGTGNVAITSAITNGTSLNGIMVYNGTGSTTTVSGTNTYSGITNVGAAGTATTVKIGSATALGFGGASSVNGNTVVATGSTLDLNGQTVNEPISIVGTGVGGTGVLINSNTGTTAVVDSGLAAISSGIAGAGYTDGTYSLTLTGGGGTGAAATATVVGGVVTQVQVTNAGSGYTSNPTASLVGAGTPTTVATFPTLASAVTLTGASTVGGAGNITANGSVVGGGALTKIGAGTLTLNGINALGANVITAGTLMINGATTATSYALGSANLGGSSSTTGLVTTGGTTSHLAPGAAGAVGTLTLSGGVNAAAGASFDFQLGTSSDLLSLGTGVFTGSTAAGGLIFNFSDAGGLSAGTAYTLATFASSTGLDYTDFFTNGPAGFTLDGSFGTGGYQINGTSLQVQFAAVPEPSTYALFLGGLGLLLVLRRKNQKSA